MRAAVFTKQHGEECILFLRDQHALNPHFKSKTIDDRLYFIVLEEPTHTYIEYVDVVASNFEKVIKTKSLREALQNKIPHIEQLKTAFDQIGSIAILEIDNQFREYEAVIGETLLSLNPYIKTVLRKNGEHQGTFRTQSMIFLAGEDTRETIHQENGIKLIVNVETVYFSPRLSNERLRIAHEVENGESILHMFSGCAPCECVIAKCRDVAQIGLELNPQGHVYGLKNTALNKFNTITLHNQDAATFETDLRFDRIIMNLPKEAYSFLDKALSLLKPGGTIHYYDFLHEDEFDIAKERIANVCRKAKRTYSIKGIHTCGSQGVRTYRICVDVVVE